MFLFPSRYFSFPKMPPIVRKGDVLVEKGGRGDAVVVVLFLGAGAGGVGMEG